MIFALSREPSDLLSFVWSLLTSQRGLPPSTLLFPTSATVLFPLQLFDLQLSLFVCLLVFFKTFPCLVVVVISLKILGKARNSSILLTLQLHYPVLNIKSVTHICGINEDI